MDSLVKLEDNLRQLLAQYQELQEQMRLLKEDNLRKQSDLEQAYADLHQLRRDHQQLQAAYALVAGDELKEEERLKAKQSLTAVITQIDKALEVLKH
jgi:hypothetical protein